MIKHRTLEFSETGMKGRSDTGLCNEYNITGTSASPLWVCLSPPSPPFISRCDATLYCYTGVNLSFRSASRILKYIIRSLVAQVVSCYCFFRTSGTLEFRGGSRILEMERGRVWKTVCLYYVLKLSTLMCKHATSFPSL